MSSSAYTSILIYINFTHQLLGNWFCLECKQGKVEEYHLSKHLVICMFIWEINLGSIVGANLCYVTDFVCLMCTIVNLVLKIFSND